MSQPVPGPQGAKAKASCALVWLQGQEFCDLFHFACQSPWLQEPPGARAVWAADVCHMTKSNLEAAGKELAAKQVTKNAVEFRYCLGMARDAWRRHDWTGVCGWLELARRIAEGGEPWAAQRG